MAETVYVWASWLRWRFFDRRRNPYLSGPACRTLTRGEYRRRNGRSAA